MSLHDTAGFDAFVSTLPGVTLMDQWDSRVAKVGGKVFALLGALGKAEARIVFKCGEASFEILTALDGVDQAPYFAKRQWVSVAGTAGLTDDELRAYILRSHGLVARGLTKKLRHELGIG